eukprot:Phypoly_transcript_05871.p1 GENE.Phypoly_transcript_05871~~Phypoly_transcript_05871.p1  ORF type:complete len:465 (+),score=86.60 Phypoly_transcript_05871:472-1866(+)
MMSRGALRFLRIYNTCPPVRQFSTSFVAKPKGKGWLVGVGTLTAIAFSFGTVYSEEKAKKEIEAKDIEGKPSASLVSDTGSAPVIPTTPQKKKIVHVMTEDQKREMEERLRAEQAAKEVLKEHSSHENEDTKHRHHPLSSSHREYPIEVADIVFPPNVPPPITRSHPARVLVNMNTYVKEIEIDPTHTYDGWTFNGSVPGPFIRARRGDILEVHFRNEDTSGMWHNLDFHAVSGPGGGASLLTAEQGETKRACFKLLYPGLFIYHCAVDPISVHVANGMYGAILVEPEEGLPHVDKEYSVVQSEFYAVADDDPNADKKKLVMSYPDVQTANPSHVVFNGRDGALIDNPLLCETDSRVRIYFVNAGPNLVSSFHIIGTIFDKLYREGDLVSSPSRGIQSTCVPAGGAAVVEMKMSVPGTYSIIDHSLNRVEKGAVGYLTAIGPERPDIFHSEEAPKNCPDCRLHP